MHIPSVSTHLGQHCPGNCRSFWSDGQVNVGHLSIAQRGSPPWHSHDLHASNCHISPSWNELKSLIGVSYHINQNYFTTFYGAIYFTNLVCFASNNTGCLGFFYFWTFRTTFTRKRRQGTSSTRQHWARMSRTYCCTVHTRAIGTRIHSEWT